MHDLRQCGVSMCPSVLPILQVVLPDVFIHFPLALDLHGTDLALVPALVDPIPGHSVDDDLVMDVDGVVQRRSGFSTRRRWFGNLQKTDFFYNSFEKTPWFKKDQRLFRQKQGVSATLRSDFNIKNHNLRILDFLP